MNSSAPWKEQLVSLKVNEGTGGWSNHPSPPFWNFVGTGNSQCACDACFGFHVHRSLFVSFQPLFYGESYHHTHFIPTSLMVPVSRGVLLTTIVTSCKWKDPDSISSQTDWFLLKAFHHWLWLILLRIFWKPSIQQLNAPAWWPLGMIHLPGCRNPTNDFVRKINGRIKTKDRW